MRLQSEVLEEAMIDKFEGYLEEQDPETVDEHLQYFMRREQVQRRKTSVYGAFRKCLDDIASERMTAAYKQLESSPIGKKGKFRQIPVYPEPPSVAELADSLPYQKRKELNMIKEPTIRKLPVIQKL